MVEKKGGGKQLKEVGSKYCRASDRVLIRYGDRGDLKGSQRQIEKLKKKIEEIPNGTKEPLADTVYEKRGPLANYHKMDYTVKRGSIKPKWWGF